MAVLSREAASIGGGHHYTVYSNLPSKSNTTGGFNSPTFLVSPKVEQAVQSSIDRNQNTTHMETQGSAGLRRSQPNGENISELKQT